MRTSLTVAGIPAVAALAVLVAELAGPVPAVAAVTVGTGVAAALHGVVRARRQPDADAGPAVCDRAVLEQRLQEALTRRRPGQELRLAVVALEGLREIDDALGHRVGDEVLQAAGERLQEMLRRDDVIARLRGGAFVVLLAPVLAGEDVHPLSRRLRACLSEPLSVEGMVLHVGAQVGIVDVPPDADAAGEVLGDVTASLHRTREETPDHARRPTPWRRLEELRRAMEADRLSVHFQPKTDLYTGRVRGAEALVRWEHPVRGTLAPDAFLPLARGSSVDRDVTLRVLEVALQQCAAWRLLGWELEVAVNVSETALFDERLADDVVRLLGEAGVAPGLLSVEIAETLLMRDYARVRQAVGALRGMGVRVSVDDYGTGTSTLGHLSRLGITELKLDGSLVAGLGTDGEVARRARSAVHTAHALGVELVAEGVEDRVHWELLRDAGCDLAQGFHISRPLPPELFGMWLRTQPVVGRLPRP